MVQKKEKRLILSLEDETGFEDWPLPAIVPLVFSEFKNKIEAECYFGVYDVVRTFLSEGRKNLFSKESLEELNRRLLPYLEAEGYARDGGIYRFYRSFVLWSAKDLNDAPIRADSFLLTEKNAARVKVNRTGFDLAELREQGCEAVGTVAAGELLSIACVNAHSEGQKLLEAAVYTLPEARGRGYGRSNVALLCKTLLAKKKGIVYCCSCRNRASIALAKAVGFREESRFYAVDAYKIEK